MILMGMEQVYLMTKMVKVWFHLPCIHFDYSCFIFVLLHSIQKNIPKSEMRSCVLQSKSSLVAFWSSENKTRISLKYTLLELASYGSSLFLQFHLLMIFVICFFNLMNFWFLKKGPSSLHRFFLVHIHTVKLLPFLFTSGHFQNAWEKCQSISWGHPEIIL